MHPGGRCRLVADFATGSFKGHRVRVGRWSGRGRGAVQGSAREHTPRPGALEAPSPRLACQALPAPPAPAWRQHRWSAGNQVDVRYRLLRGCTPRRAAVVPSGRRQNPAPPGRGCGVGQGGVREARRKSWRLRGASPCVRVPRHERRHGRGLAAPRPCPRQAVEAAQPDTPAAAIERPLSRSPAKSANSRRPPLESVSPETCVAPPWNDVVAAKAVANSLALLNPARSPARSAPPHARWPARGRARSARRGPARRAPVGRNRHRSGSPPRW